jgi:predicted nucleic acid-binding protein
MPHARADDGHAADRVDALFASAAVDVLQSTRADELDALRWMRKYADQRISFTDCVSFALMRRHRIRAAFTFDRHFKVAGFEVIGFK